MHLKKGILELKFDEEKLDGVLRHLYAANKSLKVGILEGAQTTSEGPSIAEIAYWNEFGTHSKKDNIHIPARPFFRNAISNNTDTWAESIRSQLKFMGVTDKNIVEKVLKKTGQLMRSDIQQSISKGGFVPNHPYTIKMKGGRSTPLVDTGDMRNAINFEVSNSRGE